MFNTDKSSGKHHWPTGLTKFYDHINLNTWAQSNILGLWHSCTEMESNRILWIWIWAWVRSFFFPFCILTIDNFSLLNHKMSSLTNEAKHPDKMYGMWINCKELLSLEKPPPWRSSSNQKGINCYRKLLENLTVSQNPWVKITKLKWDTQYKGFSSIIWNDSDDIFGLYESVLLWSISQYSSMWTKKHL